MHSGVSVKKESWGSRHSLILEMIISSIARMVQPEPHLLRLLTEDAESEVTWLMPNSLTSALLWCRAPTGSRLLWTCVRLAFKVDGRLYVNFNGSASNIYLFIYLFIKTFIARSISITWIRGGGLLAGENDLRRPQFCAESLTDV